MADPPAHRWSSLPAADALTFHKAFVAAHPRRVESFLTELERRGFDRTGITFTSLDDIDAIFDFAVANMYLDRAHRQPNQHTQSDWLPDVGGFTVPAAWPPWAPLYSSTSSNDLKFVSALSDCLAQFMIVSWDASWALYDDKADLSRMNRSVIVVEGVRTFFPTDAVAGWFHVHGVLPRERIWRGLETAYEAGGHRHEQVPVELAEVEVERFEDDGPLARNWFYVMIDSDFTATANYALVESLAERLSGLRRVAEAYRSDREWVAVKSRGYMRESTMQKLVDKAWEAAKEQHPPILDDE